MVNNKSEVIRDAILSLPVAKQYALPAEPNSHAMRVLIGQQAAKLGIKVKTFSKGKMVFIVRIE
jgi:hypothetical protein